MAALVFVAIGVTISWFEQPPRITEQFVGETYHERYEDAVPMLLVPSAVSVESVGFGDEGDSAFPGRWS